MALTDFITTRIHCYYTRQLNQPKKNNNLPPVKITTTQATKEYKGKEFTITLPANWQVSNFSSECGEMEAENITISIPAFTGSNNKISICVEEAESKDASIISYSGIKQLITENIQKGLITSYTETTIDNRSVLIYEIYRKDFPGQYEKTAFISANNLNFRITWSIRADDNATRDKLIRLNTTEYDDAVKSLIIK